MWQRFIEIYNRMKLKYGRLIQSPLFGKSLIVVSLSNGLNVTIFEYCIGTMSTPLINEIFPDITLTVDLTKFQHGDNVSGILDDYCLEKSKGMCCEFKGSFEEVEDVFWKLSVVKRSTDLRHQTRDHQDHSSPTQIEPVEVIEAVMDYIKLKYQQELDRTVGNDVYIKSRANNKISFHLHSGRDMTRCLFARERFITFYQKIATELNETVFDIDPMLIAMERKRIDRELPKLLINSDSRRHTSSCVSVTGSNADRLRCEYFLKSGATISHNPTTQHRSSEREQQSQTTVNAASSSSTTQDQPMEKEDCPICLDTIKETEKETLRRCKHSFCRGCLSRAFELKPACPICGILYGSLKGTQPDKGTMEFSYNGTPLPGNYRYGSIIIRYNIPSGIQGEEHPNPGKRYEGAARTAFLPDSPEGKKVLQLLQKAFEQRLIFTIGQSSTSGRSNVVTWNDIHHKTSRDGGPTNYGYPDPDYLDRVQEELKVKGIY
ncbi:hypothetical protein AAFF_G00315270 [Aldrovandia affinis]|uniref:E3 ubiquitin-protein ligase n=1 Tax=Aldrovandia affinis TaxID=143900 RepID=A0AAD7SP15_9TELE|nr:hypothetical protein AAFF_G00315270 [Aldrovandia affinis]